VKNARLFTMAPGQKDTFTGYIVVDADGKLAAVAAGDPPAGLQAVQTWDAGGHWIMPGFLSAHSHLWQAAFRGIAADKTLPGWIDGLYNVRASKAQPDDFYWFTLDGALDHLEHGITAAYNFNYGGTRWGLCHETTATSWSTRLRSILVSVSCMATSRTRYPLPISCPRHAHD